MKLKYGDTYLELDTNKLRNWTVLDNDVRAEKQPEAIIKQALENPIASLPLRKIIKKGEKVCLVISDVSRAYQRQDFFLPYVVEEIKAAGVADEDITLLCALGAHDKQTEAEKDLILGSLKGRFVIEEHDCFDESNLADLGTTAYGSPIRLNKKLTTCDRVILTGAIVPHDMAGYGGGRKSIAPGLAGYDTIAANHRKVFNREGTALDPACVLGNLKGNAMHEDMTEMCEKIAPDFLFNVILDAEGRLYKAVAGDWQQAFYQGAEYCDEVSAAFLPEKADLVIAGAGGYPKDADLYQASKCFSSAVLAAKPGGRIIIAARCDKNMGNQESVDIILDHDTNEERTKALCETFVPEAYSGYLVAYFAEKYDVIMVSDYGPKEELERCGIRVCKTMEEALRLVDMKQIEKTYVIPNCASIVPKMAAQQED